MAFLSLFGRLYPLVWSWMFHPVRLMTFFHSLRFSLNFGRAKRLGSVHTRQWISVDLLVILTCVITILYFFSGAFSFSVSFHSSALVPMNRQFVFFKISFVGSFFVARNKHFTSCYLTLNINLLSAYPHSGSKTGAPKLLNVGPEGCVPCKYSNIPRVFSVLHCHVCTFSLWLHVGNLKHDFVSNLMDALMCN